MDDIRKARQKREYGMTTAELWEEERQAVEEADQVVVITIKDGVSSFQHSGGKALEMVGALHHAQFVLMHNSIHWEET